MQRFSSPLFQDLTDFEWEDLQKILGIVSRTFKKGNVIFHEGEHIQELGIVQEGSVNIENIDLWGNRSILSHIAEGQVFGETYAFSQEPLMVDVVAAEDCTVCFLNLRILMNGYNTNCSWYPKMLKNMLQVSVEKNRVLSNRIFCTSAKTIRGRLLTYLSALSVKKGSRTFQVPFDRQQMADYLNLDRSALSKELGRMRDEGLIEFHKNTFRIKEKP